MIAPNDTKADEFDALFDAVLAAAATSATDTDAALGDATRKMQIEGVTVAELQEFAAGRAKLPNLRYLVQDVLAWRKNRNRVSSSPVAVAVDEPRRLPVWYPIVNLECPVCNRYRARVKDETTAYSECTNPKCNPLVKGAVHG